MGLGSNDCGPDTQYESSLGRALTWVGTLLSYLYLLTGPILYIGFILIAGSYKLYTGAEPGFEEVYSVFIVVLIMFVLGGVLVALSFWLLREGPRRFAPKIRIWMASSLFFVMALISFGMFAQSGQVSDVTNDTVYVLVLVSSAWAAAMLARAAIEQRRRKNV